MTRRIRICLIEDDKKILEQIGSRVNGSEMFEMAGTACDGARGEELLRNVDFDAAIIGAILRLKDGISLIRGHKESLKASENGGSGIYAVLAESFHESLKRNAMDAGADIFMVKPVDIDDLLNEITILFNKKNNTGVPSVDAFAEDLLLGLGIHDNLKGHKYLKSAISKTVDNRSVTDGITKLLYPGIAKENASTSARVERDIRHAIGESWRKGSKKKFAELLNHEGFLENKPTNRVFILAASEVVAKRKMLP